MKPAKRRASRAKQEAMQKARRDERLGLTKKGASKKKGKK